MNKKVERNYLEINSLKDLKESINHLNQYSIELVDPADFQLNKFFYKKIGEKHHWVDRLSWPEKEWINYTVDQKIRTYILKNKDDLADAYLQGMYFVT